MIELDGDVTVSLVANNKKGYALFATEEGSVKQVFRTQYPGSGITCGFPHVDAYAGRLLVDIAHNVQSTYHWDRFVGTLNDSTLLLSNPDFSKLTMPSGQTVGAPGHSDIISGTLQFFSSYGYTVLSSMEFGKPETLKLLYHPEITPLGASVVQRHGDRVAYTVRTSVGLGGERTTYYLSDGKSQGSVYLDSNDKHDIGSLRFAHSYVAWLKGGYLNNGSQNRTNVEIWASPVDSASDKLNPQFVGSFPEKTTVYSTVMSAEGGFGYYALPWAGEGQPQGIQVWNLKTHTKQLFSVPKGTILRSIKGITQKYVWATILTNMALILRVSLRTNTL